MATPINFSIQQVFEVLVQDPSTDAIIGYLDDLKTSKLDNTATLVYPTGGRGNAYIGGAFAHSRKASIEIAKATWNTNLMAVKAGGSVVLGANTNAMQYDVLTVATNAANTKFTALGTAGAEIKYAYIVGSDGSYGSTPLTQGATPAANVFSYVPGTKTINFYASDSMNGKNIAVAYAFNTGATAQTISITTDKFPSLAKVTLFGLAKNLCDGYLYPVRVQGNAQIDPNWAWDLAADGEPAIENFKLEFVKSCASKKLYDIIISDDSSGT